MRSDPTLDHGSVRRRTTRKPKLLAAASLVTMLVLALAAPALAHVHADAEDAEGGLVRIVLSFSHGCETEPTIALRAQLPEGATEVTAEDLDGWTSEVTATQVSWTGGSVPDGEEAEFAFTARLAQSPGEEVSIPTIQECTTLSNDWIEPPTDDHSEASSPAPTFTVPAGATPGTADGGEDEGSEDVAPISVPEDELDEEDDTATAISVPEEDLTAEVADGEEGANAGGDTGLVVFIIVVVVILGGGTLLYLQNRGKGNNSTAGGAG